MYNKNMNLLSHRNSNIELYRIIVMFLIVCHHYVVNSGLMELMKEDSLVFSINILLFIWNVGENWNKLFCSDNRLFHVYFKYHTT